MIHFYEEERFKHNKHFIFLENANIVLKITGLIDFFRNNIKNLISFVHSREDLTDFPHYSLEATQFSESVNGCFNALTQLETNNVDAAFEELEKIKCLKDLILILLPDITSDEIVSVLVLAFYNAAVEINLNFIRESPEEYECSFTLDRLSMASKTLSESIIKSTSFTEFAKNGKQL